MPQYYEYELMKAANKLVTETLNLKPGETLVITADTESDFRVVDATAAATFAAECKPLVLWNGAPLGVGKAGDSYLPGEAICAALIKADAWVEYNNKWILYSRTYEKVMEANKKLRHIAYCGMDVGMMVRVIGRVDIELLEKYQNRLLSLIQAARHVRLRTPAGGDVEFENEPTRAYVNEFGHADTPGTHGMGGEISWAPITETINGAIVFEGSINPPFGLIKEPVRLNVRNGRIEKIEGGPEARVYEAWLNSFGHPNMLRFAHVSIGCNPGARLSGKVIEDERIWGNTWWGIGYSGSFLTGGDPIDAPSHSDGICLNTSLWLDRKKIWDQGRSLDHGLNILAKKLGKN